MAENSKIYEIEELPNGKWVDGCAAHFVRARAHAKRFGSNLQLDK
jgi:hypothetical protein